MANTLKDLGEVIYDEEKEFHKKIIKAAKGITLNQVVKETLLDKGLPGRLASRMDYKFEKGSELSFYTANAHYDITLSPNTLTVRTKNIVILEFTGSEVQEQYAQLEENVMKAIDDYMENLPF